MCDDLNIIWMQEKVVRWTAFSYCNGFHHCFKLKKKLATDAHRLTRTFCSADIAEQKRSPAVRGIKINCRTSQLLAVY